MCQVCEMRLKAFFYSSICAISVGILMCFYKMVIPGTILILSPFLYIGTRFLFYKLKRVRQMV